MHNPGRSGVCSPLQTQLVPIPLSAMLWSCCPAFGSSNLLHSFLTWAPLSNLVLYTRCLFLEYCSSHFWIVQKKVPPSKRSSWASVGPVTLSFCLTSICCYQILFIYTLLCWPLPTRMWASWELGALLPCSPLHPWGQGQCLTQKALTKYLLNERMNVNTDAAKM